MREETVSHVFTKPAQIKWATSLLWASLAIGGIKTIMDWTHLTGQASLAFTLYILAFTFAITALLIWMIGRGKNWARIVFLVLFLLGLLPYFFILRSDFARSPASATVGLIQTAAQGIALFMLFTSPGKEWFRAVRG